MGVESTTSMLTKSTDREEFKTAIRRNRRSPAEVARLAVGRKPFSYREWRRRAPPATPEELADWEEFLRQREAERAASLAREAGIDSGAEAAG